MTRLFDYRLTPETFCLCIVDALSCFLAVYLVWGPAADAGLAPAGPAPSEVAAVAAAIALAMALVAFSLGFYRPELYLHTRRLLTHTGVGGTIAFIAIGLVVHAASSDVRLLVAQQPLLPAKLSAAWLVLLAATHGAFSCALRMNLFVRRIVVVGTPDEATLAAEAVFGLGRKVFDVTDVVAVPADTGQQAAADALRHALAGRRKVWGIVVAGEAAGLMPALQACRRGGVRVIGVSEFWDHYLKRVDLERLRASDLTGAAEPALAAAVRRAGAVGLALSLLLFTLPLMAMTALLIKLDSGGPLLYRQERVGLNGKPFQIIKFRSMRVDAEAQGPVWAAQRDARVTRVGAFIRLTRIDELPQLVNILRGDMALIGPRPERPHFVAQLADAIPFYPQRSRVKPGLTGWAQVCLPYGASIEETRMKLSYDLYYVTHRSWRLDLMILFATVRVVLFQEGAR